MNKWKKRLSLGAAVVVGFVLGAGIVAAGKTRTITTAAAAARVQTVTVSRVTTHVKTRTVTPAACRQAIARARLIATDAAAGFAVAAKWPRMMTQAAQAGINQDAATINSLAATLQSDTLKLNAATSSTVSDALAFNGLAARCR